MDGLRRGGDETVTKDCVISTRKGRDVLACMNMAMITNVSDGMRVYGTVCCACTL